jgi:hypothetical protein
MTRVQIAETVASVARMAADLVSEAEEENEAKREEIESLREEIKARDFIEDRMRVEIADYERSVGSLREQLREEQERRANYQAVHGYAVRFVRGCEWRPAGGKAEITAPDDDVWQGLLDSVRSSGV